MNYVTGGIMALKLLTAMAFLKYVIDKFRTEVIRLMSKLVSIIL